MTAAKMDYMLGEVSAALEKLERLFTSDVKVTFIARFDDNEEADVLIGDDDPVKLRALVDRMIARDRGERPGFFGGSERS